MDVSLLNSLILGILGLVVFFYLLHTTVRSAVRLGIRDAQRDKDSTARQAPEGVSVDAGHDV